MPGSAETADRDAPDTPRSRNKTILTLNAGSSSVKLALFDAHDGIEPILTGLVERIGSDAAQARLVHADGAALDPGPMPPEAARDHAGALGWVLPRLHGALGAGLLGAGHRVVHGGARFDRPVRVDDDVLDGLERLVPLARTHQPHALAALRAVAALWPDLPQVACFDTAFHATLPESARAFALPGAITRHGVRRYGFHGLSYDWIAGRLPEILGRTAQGRVIVAHLGNGASLCGMVGLQSRATTMGFTPLDGLVMGERPGLLDPGAVLFMMEELGMDAAAIRQVLFKESGLLGVSGLSNDMRVLTASDTDGARRALDLYIHRLVHEIGAVAAEIGGLDALVFTAGIGENAAFVRARVVERLDWLGCRLDPEANADHAQRISSCDSDVPICVIPTNEEAVILRAVRNILL